MKSVLDPLTSGEVSLDTEILIDLAENSDKAEEITRYENNLLKQVLNLEPTELDFTNCFYGSTFRMFVLVSIISLTVSHRSLTHVKKQLSFTSSLYSISLSAHLFSFKFSALFCLIKFIGTNKLPDHPWKTIKLSDVAR